MTTERDMLDRLRVRYGKTDRNGSYTGRQYVIAEKVPTTQALGAVTGSPTHRARHLVCTPPQRAHRNRVRRRAMGRTPIRARLRGQDLPRRLARRTPPAREGRGLAQFCHTFSLVAADRRIVRDDLPDGGGAY